MSFPNGDLYKLVYFNARGVCENTRIMLAIANVQYEDFRFPVDFKTFARPEFDAAKADGKTLVGNMGRAPVLQLPNGKTIGQSKTIERFIAAKHGFLGSDEIEAALVDMVSTLCSPSHLLLIISPVSLAKHFFWFFLRAFFIKLWLSNLFWVVNRFWSTGGTSRTRTYARARARKKHTHTHARARTQPV